MIQWKQRLYAFLLRRLLGPFLDASATKQLHDSLDFSIQEGRYTLKDISLNANHLNSIIASGSTGLSIRSARIGILKISLELRENVSDHGASESSIPRSSLAWRAMKLGTGTGAMPAVSLIAAIEISDVSLELEPSAVKPRQTPPHPQKHKPAPDPQELESSRSVIGSYVDAALSSLQLDLKVSNISVKVSSSRLPVPLESWVEVLFSSIAYRDVEVAASSRNASGYKTVLNKSLEFAGFRIQAGDTWMDRTDDDDESSNPVATQRGVSTIALAQGHAKVFIRVIECEPASPTATENDQKPRLQQDVEVTMNQQLNLSVDQAAILQLRNVSVGLSSVPEAEEELVPLTKEASDALDRIGVDNSRSDQGDLAALNGILKQYQEAYHLAERNELRGGILIPSNAYEDGVELEDDEPVTFDAFFDANEQSVYHYASVLKESLIMSRNSESKDEFVHTKLRLHLTGGGFKLVFADPTRPTYVRRLEEYLLLTFDDLNFSSSMSLRTSDHSLSVSHLEIEDAQIDKSYSGGETFVSIGGQPLAEGRVEIGNFLRFVSLGEDNSLEDSMVAPAPAMSLHVNSRKNSKHSTTVSCDITLSSLELVYRHRTASNMMELLKQLREIDDRSDQGHAIDNSVEKNRQELSFSGSCPSVMISLPLLEHVDTDSLFHRRGEVLYDEQVSQPSLGLLIEHISIEWDDAPSNRTDEMVVADAGLKLSCHQLLFFASSPVGGSPVVGAKMQRTDIIVVRGRMEVNPYFPISISVSFKSHGNSERNYGRDSFPVTPTISSFKARQEDEDEELKIDRVLFSKLQDVEADSRKELRGTDPQSSMISNAEKCEVVVVVNIPELLGDFTAKELEVLLRMVNATTPSTVQTSPIETSDDTDASEPLCIAFNCHQVSLLLHSDITSSNPGSDVEQETQQVHSYILAMDQLKGHTVLTGAKAQHVRVLCHEPCFYEACCDFENHRGDTSRTADRFKFVKDRAFRGLSASASPIFYRSRLFAPISHESPSILFDFIDQTSSRPKPQDTFRQRRLHFTLYHLTYRYDVDSKWIDRLSGVIGGQTKEDPSDAATSELLSSESNGQSSDNSSLTRIFITLADCNLDYTSAPYFKTPSRTILRIGDLRVSSNVMVPAGRVQAYSVSLGDVTLHLINTRYPYQAENSNLCRATIVLGQVSPSFAPLEPGVALSNPETLLRELCFINIFSLDSMDAIVAVSTNPKKNVDQPASTISLTFGLLSVQACKDSFECLSSTIGEVQAKLTALTDADIEKMKTCTNGQSFDNTYAEPMLDHGSNGGEKNSQDIDGIDTLGPLIGANSKQFLLDGYDWTTVDHDLLPEPEMPAGEEQVAMWYTTKPGNQFDGATYPSRIIHEHFPMHTVSDPLSDGDMDAARFAGTPFAPQAKSRLLVHNLKVKLRFFDGYDWPESLSSAKRKFAGRDGSSFVIEPLPEPPIGGPSEIKPKSIDDSQKRKAKLLDDLLIDSDERPTTFSDIPLPEDRGAMLERQALSRLLTRKFKFFQISASGVSLRMDSFAESEKHQLVSILDLAVHDIFLAETVSRPSPVKMVGEWVNEKEHPRDSKDGILMFKMVTWHPLRRVTPGNQVASDECEVTMKFLPMRCIVDQCAIAFIRAFFGSDGEETKCNEPGWMAGLHLLPPPKFRVFRVKPWKLKVDYCPKTLDLAALREGSFVELINLSPIDGMVITLRQVNVENVVGGGEVLGGLSRSWVQEICATQLHKFLTNARPFEPFANVSSGVADLVVLPYEALRNGEDVRRAIRSGITSLAGIVAFEALTTTSRLTQYAAKKMANAVGGTALQPSSITANSLPSRPLETPKGVGDVAGHVMESLARGVQVANYKVIVVPYREYSKKGATGAAKSVLKGIPVLVVGPLSGATEAISYTLLGARNALRPDIRKEEEAHLRGLHYEM